MTLKISKAISRSPLFSESSSSSPILFERGDVVLRKVGFVSIQRRKIIVVDIAGQLVIELFFLVVVPLQLLDNLYVCPSMFGQWKRSTRQ